MGAQVRRKRQAYSQLLFGREREGGASLREAASLANFACSPIPSYSSGEGVWGRGASLREAASPPESSPKDVSSGGSAREGTSLQRSPLPRNNSLYRFCCNYVYAAVADVGNDHVAGVNGGDNVRLRQLLHTMNDFLFRDGGARLHAHGHGATRYGHHRRHHPFGRNALLLRIFFAPLAGIAGDCNDLAALQRARSCDSPWGS